MDTRQAPATDGKPESGESPAMNWLLTLVVDLGLPIATYFLLAGPVGMGAVPALLLSGLWPALGLVVTYAQQRHVDEFGLFVAIGIAVGVLTALWSDSSRALFLRESVTTGVTGIVFLASLLVGRPLTFYLGRRFATDGSRVQRDWWDGLWRHPRFRRVQRRLGLVWGVGLVGEALVRGVLTWQLGTSARVVVNNVVPYAVIAGLAAYSVATGRRERAAAERQHGRAALPPAAEG